MLNERLDVPLENCVLFLQNNERNLTEKRMIIYVRLLSLIWKARFLLICQNVEQYLFDQNQEGPFKIPSMSIVSFFSYSPQAKTLPACHLQQQLLMHRLPSSVNCCWKKWQNTPTVNSGWADSSMQLVIFLSMIGSFYFLWLRQKRNSRCCGINRKKGFPPYSSKILIKYIHRVFLLFAFCAHVKISNRCNGNHIFLNIFLEIKEEKCFLHPYFLTLYFLTVFMCQSSICIRTGLNP